jgi:RNA polymerase sigma factor (sigma-70 family)
MKSKGQKKWHNLFSTNPQRAWELFLQEYNRAILAVVKRYVYDHDDQMEMFTHVLEQLRKDDFTRITSFFTESRPYDFDGWLLTVSRNCCIDWLRRKKGDLPSKYIRAMPEIDQCILNLIYRDGYSYEETYEVLKSSYGFKKSYEEMIVRLDDLIDSLQRNTRLKLFEKRIMHLPLLSLDQSSSNPQNPQQEKEIIKNETRDILAKILQTLPDQERLIIELHMVRGMTLKETARVLKIKNIWRLHRKMRRILGCLKERLIESGVGPSDLDI